MSLADFAASCLSVTSPVSIFQEELELHLQHLKGTSNLARVLPPPPPGETETSEFAEGFLGNPH